MAEKIIRPLQDTSNAQVLDAIWNEASLDYQNRIPRATQAGVQATVQALTQFRPKWNEFVDALINRIGSVVVRNMSWQNPLAEFKRGMLTYGDTIEEIQVGLLNAHTYDPQREYLEKDLFGVEKPNVQSQFHTVNRQNFYKVTVNDYILRRAFLQDTGLSTFISALMEAPATSDEWDEFLLTISLIDEYQAAGGFWHVNVPDVRNYTADSTDAKAVLRKIRAMSETLKFPSTRYNAARMPTFARPEDLFLLVTPEFKATIDVEALAGAFNVDRTDVPSRMVTIPDEHFAKSGFQAVLTTRDFFVIADTLLENTSQPNAAGLYNNYFLHHHEIMSVSRFVPAVAFWTGADDEVVEISTPVTGISALTVHEVSEDGPTVTEVNRGGTYVVTAEGVTTPEGGTNVAVRYSVEGAASTKTQVSQEGVLDVGGDEPSDELTIRATTTWLDPTNVRKVGQTTTTVVTVQGDVIPEWPLPRQDGAPTVTTVLPAGQSVDEEVTITGTGLGDVSSVTIGGEPTTFEVVSPTSVTAIIPDVAAGAQPVVVTDSEGSSAPVDYTVV